MSKIKPADIEKIIKGGFFIVTTAVGIIKLGPKMTKKLSEIRQKNKK